MLNVPRPVGFAAIMLFAAILAVAIWMVTRGDAQPPEEAGTSQGGEMIRAVPLPPDEIGAAHGEMHGEVLVSLKLDEATIQCADGSPRLSLRSAEELPAGAVVIVQPSREVPTGSPDSREFEPAGPPERFSVPSPTRDVEAVLAKDAVPADAEVLAIYVTAAGADGVGLQSQTEFVDASVLNCGGGS